VIYDGRSEFDPCMDKKRNPEERVRREKGQAPSDSCGAKERACVTILVGVMREKASCINCDLASKYGTTSIKKNPRAHVEIRSSRKREEDSRRRAHQQLAFWPS
jgi:hypothetical protein